MIQVFPITDSFFSDLVRALLLANSMQILIIFVPELIKFNETSMFLFWYFSNQTAGFLRTFDNFAHHEYSFPLYGIDCNFPFDWVIFNVVEDELLVWPVSHLYRIFFIHNLNISIQLLLSNRKFKCALKIILISTFWISNKTINIVKSFFMKSIPKWRKLCL